MSVHGDLYYVYVARTTAEAGPAVVGVSHYPYLDLAALSEYGYDRLAVADGPIPLAPAELEAEHLRRRIEGTGTTRWRLFPRLRWAPAASFPLTAPLKSDTIHRGVGTGMDSSRAGIRPRGGAARHPARAIITRAECRTVDLPPPECLDAVLEVLRGRILFENEIRRALHERAHSTAERLGDALQVLIVRGLIGRAPSVAVDRFGIATCTRCGGRDDIVESSCASCGDDQCLRCVECASMGEARSCRPLYYAPRQARPLRPSRHVDVAGRADDLDNVDDADRADDVDAADGANGRDRAGDRNDPPDGPIDRVDPAGRADEADDAHEPGAVTSHRRGTSTEDVGARRNRYLIGVSRRTARARANPDGAAGPGPAHTVTTRAVVLPFELTGAQRDASLFVESFVAKDERSECLVYAVCGAGKTEVCLGAVASVVRQGGLALFAVPRSDVVADVAPRIAAAIPDARVIDLRGASRERYHDADIVVATTHQVLRFYQAFDLVVLDEADAFPFRGSRLLRHALRRATAPEGKTIYMTATPDRTLLDAVDRCEMAVTRISARHHGYPLPVPVVVTTSLPSAGGEGQDDVLRAASPRATPSRKERGPRTLPDEVVALVAKSVASGHSVFLFVPTVGLTGRVCAMLKASFTQPDGLSDIAGHLPPAACTSMCMASDAAATRPRVAFVHSRHPERDRLRQAFKEGEIDVLVTTTIMERGITVPTADVIVLYADFERVFDSGTLVQMAGRAGRSRDYPAAMVYFVAEHTSPAMRAAIASIQEMNEHAAESGYLLQRGGHVQSARSAPRAGSARPSTHPTAGAP